MEVYQVKLNENEMFMILQALSRKIELTSNPVTAADHKRLHDRLELIYEGRV